MRGARGPELAMGAGCLVLSVAGVLPVVLPLAVISSVARAVTGTSAEPAGASGRPLPAVTGTPMTCAGLQTARGFQLPIHAGIDLDCPLGTPVRAAAGGTVHERDDRTGPCPFPGAASGGYGLVVTIDVEGSAGVQEIYGHLSGVAAPEGAHVAVGDTVGYEGTTGCSTGPHLHFEVRARDRPVNPCPLLPSGYPSDAWHRQGCPLQLRP